MTLKIAMLLNIINHDKKGRFQICREFDQRGNLFSFFAVRAVSGHGIPWLDQRRLSCPINEEDLQKFGIPTWIVACRQSYI